MDSERIGAHGFLPFGSYAPGGLSRIWGALATRWTDEELSAFPDRNGLDEGYQRVGERIGLSRAGDGGIALAEPIRPLFERHRRAAPTPGFELERASNAVLAEQQDARQACSACGLCLYGCDRGAIYSSALELPALRRSRHFTYRGGVRALTLSADANRQIVEAVSPAGRMSLSAHRIVLAAGTLATTSLALRRLDLAGRPVPLLSNPAGGAAFLSPALVGRALPATSFGLGQLFYRQRLPDEAAAAGVLYGGDTLPLSALAARMPLRRGTAMRLARALAPGLIFSSLYLPGHFSSNFVVAGEGGDGARLTIHGRQPHEADATARAAFARLAAAMGRRGAWMIPGSASMLQPGGDAHAAGTLPLDGAGPASTDRQGALRCAPDVFVVDGACLPTLPATHPTLTIMANADRIGRRLGRLVIEDRTVRHGGEPPRSSGERSFATA